MTNPNQLQQTNPEQNSVQTLLKNPTVQKKFNDVLKDKSAQFTSSLITLVSNDRYLAKSEPMSIIAGAMQAAQLDLPLEKQFGFAYLVPFRESGQQKAQFVLGYKGYIQLAMRSGQYKSINVASVYEGELESWNKFTEEIQFDPNGKVSDEVIGYVGYLKLLNGFEKTVYWTKEQIEAHRISNNKSKNKTALSGAWRDNYDAMAQKTVLRNLLSKWGYLSIEMQTAVISDETTATIDNDGSVRVDVSQSVQDEVENNQGTEVLDFDQPEETKEKPENEADPVEETGQLTMDEQIQASMAAAHEKEKAMAKDSEVPF